MPEPTERPWFISLKRGQRDGYIRTESGRTIADMRYRNGEADATMIVAAVNNYDRLKRIERTAREFILWMDGYPDLIIPGVRHLRQALEEK